LCCCCPCLSIRPLPLLPPTPTPTTSFLPAFELHTQVQLLLSLVKILPSFHRCRAVLLALWTATCLLQSKCSALAAAAAAGAAAAAAACTALCILTDLQPAIFLSPAMKQSRYLSQLQLPVRALASFNTNSASLPFRFRRRRDDCCILLHGPSSRRPHHHVDSNNATAGLPLVAITHLFRVCPNPVSSAA
jgi:hypothetical protein